MQQMTFKKSYITIFLSLEVHINVWQFLLLVF